MSDDQATTQTKSETLLRLSAPFSPSAHKKVNKGSGNQTYVPWTDAVERMNAVLGADWSFKVVREGLTETEAWVLGEISATIDGVVTVRQHYGCESITKGSRGVADLFKIAASDAIRKAATLIGVGMYLSVKEEREEIEAAMRAEVAAAVKAQQEANKPQPKAPTPINDNVRAAAAAGGAVTTLRCTQCGTDVPKDATLTILKKKEGPSVAVAVKDFEPVCTERLGSFHCARCYDKKYWGAA